MFILLIQHEYVTRKKLNKFFNIKKKYTMYALRVNLIFRVYIRELNIAVFLITIDSFC